MVIEESITGLQWVERWTISNGQTDSCVVPFATSFPVNIVTHGEQQFDYGQYGVHLGQQDSLTFLGDRDCQIFCVRAGNGLPPGRPCSYQVGLINRSPYRIAN